MRQLYTKDSNKASRENEKNSEKEILYNEKIDSSTTIERSPHDRLNPFAQINRSLIEDNSISMECRLLIIFLLSKPNDWKVSVFHLRNSFQGWAGRDKIYSLLDEAEKAGYMKKVTTLKRGCIRSNRWFISENGSFSNNVHDTDYQGLSIRKSSNNDLERSLKKEVVKKKPDRPKVVPKISPPTSATTSVSQGKEKKNIRRELTDREKDSLYAKYPKAIVDEKLKKLEDTMKKYPKAYTSNDLYYAVQCWCAQEMSKKAKTFSKKETKMEDPTDKVRTEVIAKIEQQGKNMLKFLKDFLQKNPNMASEIKIQEYCNKVDLRNLVNKKRFNTYEYLDPFFKGKFDAWLLDWKVVNGMP
jgi:hypothetical protein